MHIAYLHYLYGGDTALHHVRQFAAAAERLGHRVDVHALNLGPPEVDGAPEASRTARLRRAAKRHLSRTLHEPKELLWNARYVRRELRRLRSGDRPDALLVRDEALTGSAVATAARLDLPLVLEVNAPACEAGLYFDQYRHLPFVSSWLEGWKLRRADAFITVSSALHDHLAERHRLAPSKGTVVPNGADLSAFRPTARGAPSTRPVVGFVGSFQKFHGADLLADLALRVAGEHPEARFVFVGDGPEAGAARRKLAPLGERVTWTGLVPHAAVPGLVDGFDVAVLPDTSFYACPLKVVEWMAAGRAVVAPRYGPLRDLLEDGVEGLLFPPRDLDALSAAVLRLLRSPELRRSLGRAAAARAQGGFSWSDNAARVVAVVERAIARRGSAPRPAAAESA